MLSNLVQLNIFYFILLKANFDKLTSGSHFLLILFTNTLSSENEEDSNLRLKSC